MNNCFRDHAGWTSIDPLGPKPQIMAYEHMANLFEEINDLLRKYKHTFLGHGSDRDFIMQEGYEPYRTRMTPRDRRSYKEKAIWLKEYIEDVVSWVEAIDKDLEEAQKGEKGKEAELL